MQAGYIPAFYFFKPMSRYHSHINTAIKLIDAYKGDTPFNLFIKQFFAGKKKFGSKDRKQIASLCFCYFRLALAFKKQPTEENVLTAFFLCNTEPAEIIKSLKPEWYEKATASLTDKLSLLKNPFLPADIFPLKNELNDGINFESFCRSFFIQPDLFVRIRPKQKIPVIKKINKSGAVHSFLNNNTAVQFPAATNIEDFLFPDAEVVIQDYNSQLVLNYLTANLPEFSAKNKQPGILSVWDCCAASGGKSILLTDILQKKINLTVSDIRPASILNLHQRFKKAGIKEYQYFITDISRPEGKVPLAAYDIIICDAPCTGSGTWSRTPEQLYFFRQQTIDVYAEKQKKIVDNVSLNLKDGGLFFYITCSVFKKENEAVATYVQKELKLELKKMQYLYGDDKKADSMFVAVFKKKVK